MTLLPVDEALAIVAAAAAPLPVEEVPPEQALGRPLASDITAPIDLPPFDNSGVDGYAVRVADLAPIALPGDAGGGAARRAPGERPTRAVMLRVAGDVPAGGEIGGPLGPAETVRVMTGGRIPANADAVVMRENVEESPKKAYILHPVRSGENVRRRGEEVRAGEIAAAAGQMVNPGVLGVLISLGLTRVPVRRRPRVAILPTGNELVPAGESAPAGSLRDSSTPTLSALVASAGAVPVPLPIARDDKAALAALVERGLAEDVLITTGGVSVGDYDFVREVLEGLGVEIRFAQIAMKPGKPLVFGLRGATRVFGLPGNPGSSVATFEQFVRPTLRMMVGDPNWTPRESFADLEAPCENRGDRTWYLRGRAALRDGRLSVRPLAGQGSGTLRSLGDANAFIVLPPHAGLRAAGERVAVHLLPGIYGEPRESAGASR